ncbi:hypothetical protein LP7551_02708 [Roseibium album]|nr:hypothetical protein LP7551_02708 [Roseibium album]
MKYGDRRSAHIEKLCGTVNAQVSNEKLVGEARENKREDQ